MDWNDFVDSLAADKAPAATRTTFVRPTPKLGPNGLPMPKRSPLQSRNARQSEEFAEANADVIVVIRGAALWSPFAASLVDQLNLGRVWSERQLAAAQSMAAKIAAREEAKAAARRSALVSVDLARIEEMFAAASESGYKKPAYRANGVVIKPHWEGAGLAVYAEGRTTMGQFGMQPGYEGKVVDGKFAPTRACLAETAPALAAIAADPKGEAVRHGQRTGRCSCCGRELTAHASIDLGIGPICAQKWGF